MPTSSRRVRKGPGETVCPVCKSLTNNKDLAEIVRSGNKKGKVVCTDCGINHPRLINGDLQPTKGPVQIPGQQTLF